MGAELANEASFFYRKMDSDGFSLSLASAMLQCRYVPAPMTISGQILNRPLAQGPLRETLRQTP
jgi:hypothetical protein